MEDYLKMGEEMAATAILLSWLPPHSKPFDIDYTKIKVVIDCNTYIIEVRQLYKGVDLDDC